MYLWPRITHTFVNNPRVLINFEKFSALYLTLIPFECPVWPFSSDPGVEQLPVLQHLVLLSLYNNTSSFMLLVQGIEIFDKNIKICIFQLFRKKENSAIIGVLFFLQFFTSWKLSLQFIGHACVCITYILDVTILKF